MSTHISVYYHNQENGDYLQEVIKTSGVGQLVGTNDLAHLITHNLNGAEVVFLEYAENHPELDRWIEKTSGDPQSPAIFLYFREISTDNLWKALRLGAKECFTYPIKEEELQQAVKRIMVRTATKAALTTPAHTISFLGCKGGVGTTFLVANAATLLAQESSEKLLTVDLDLAFGQLNYFFDIHPKHTITEVVGNLDRIDKLYLQNIFYAIDQNFFILPAPASLEKAEIINAGHLEKIFSYLKSNLGFRWLLMDCGHSINEHTLKALEYSDTLVLVTAQSIPALSTAKRMLEILTLLELKALEVQVWVNFWDKQHELTLADMQRFLGKEVAGTVSYDHKQVNFSINEGKPLVASAPRIAISEDLRLLTGNFSREDAIGKTNGSRWGWLQQLLRKK